MVAVAICPPLSLVSSTELTVREHRQPTKSEEWKDFQAQLNLRHELLRQSITPESLWLDGILDPCTRAEIVLSNADNVERTGGTFAQAPIQNEEAAAFVFSLRACAKRKDLRRGSRLHDLVSERGLLKECADALITMYAKCGELEKAKELLDMHASGDVITWTALIAGYVRQGLARNAVDCFERMEHEGVAPNAVTYIVVLKACAAERASDKGQRIHDDIVKYGLLHNDIVLGTALVDMYAKCGALSKAQEVLEKLHFRDVVSWNALISGYSEEGQADQASQCFECMQLEGIAPDAVTYLCILKACASTGALEKGKQVHEEVERRHLLKENSALGNALVNMYAKCGALSTAQDVLDKLCYQDAISWNSLITGYVQDGQSEQALFLFDQMQREGVPPDAFTFSSALTACANLGAAGKGAQIHYELAERGLLKDNIVLGTALVEMYAKCGVLTKAQHVLETHCLKDVVSWNVLIAGYAQEGQGEQALSCFRHMQLQGITPNIATFVCVLNVCNHLGLVEEGYTIFTSMTIDYGLKPNLECSTCMIDLFSRAGHLEKVLQLIKNLPHCDDLAIWLSLLGACCKLGVVDVGRWAFEQAIRVDKDSGPAYVLMADLYAAAGMQKHARAIEAIRTRNKTCY